MIELHYWPTPNGHKVAIALEEMSLAYKVYPVNIGKGDQFKPEFLAFSPNNRIPAIIDHDTTNGKPQSIFESGAILLYLAEKTGQFLPSNQREKIAVYEWLIWQMGGFGPMLGQAHHFNFYAPDRIPYAMDRYSNEANRLYGVLDRQLADHEYVAGEYSIADMAIFPWTRTFKRQNVNIEDYKHVMRWRQLVSERPVVKKAFSVGKELREDLKNLDDAEWKKLFGSEHKAG